MYILSIIVLSLLAVYYLLNTFYTWKYQGKIPDVKIIPKPPKDDNLQKIFDDLLAVNKRLEVEFELHKNDKEININNFDICISNTNIIKTLEDLIIRHGFNNDFKISKSEEVRNDSVLYTFKKIN